MTSPSCARTVARPLHRRAFSGALVALFFSVGLTAVVLQSSASPAAAANVAFEQCNGIQNTGGLTVTCDVVIVNTLTASAATTGSVVTVNGGAPTSSPDLITAVDQCNGSANGGGGTITCAVHITNNISVDSPAAATAATVNQCNDNQADDGLGNAPNTCQPFPATTTGATITQCDGSGNGGGLVAPSHCNATGMVSATLPVTVNQCNGSANGGGGKVNCTVTIVSNVVDTSTTGGGTPGGGTPGGGLPGGGLPGGGVPGGGIPGVTDTFTTGLDLTEAVAPPEVVVPPIFTG